MPRADLDVKLSELRAASERIHATLVELELDSSRQMLEASTLQGTTAASWAAADRALQELWRRQRLLEQLVAAADGLRGPRHADRLRALLFDESIELAGADVPVLARSLLPGDRPGDRCSPDELLASMSALFDEARDTLGAITSAWERLFPALEEARRLLGAARALAGELGAPAPEDLTEAAHGVEALTRQAAEDPLAVAAPAVTGLLTRLEQLRATLAADAELKHTVDGRVLAARQLLGRVRDTALACREAQAILEAKVVCGTAPALPPPADALERGLEAITLAAAGGAWRAARTDLESWQAQVQTHLEQAEATLAALRAPVQARDQFRALLDAYSVKARRLGRLEDPELEEIFARARAELYTAPTDLARAAELVRRYQLAISGVSTSEASR